MDQRVEKKSEGRIYNGWKAIREAKFSLEFLPFGIAKERIIALFCEPNLRHKELQFQALPSITH